MASNGSSKGAPGGSGTLSIGSVARLLVLMIILGVVVGLALRLVSSHTPVPPPADTTPKPPGDVSSGTNNTGNSHGGHRGTKPGGDGQNTGGQLPLPPDNTDTKKPVVEVVPAEEQRAKELLEAARVSLQQMDFAGARKACGEAAPLRATAATRGDVQALGRKVEQFEWAVAHIEVSEFARAEKSCALQLRGGRRERGLIAEEQPDRLTLVRVSEQNPAAPGIAKMTIPLADIEQRREVTLAERQAEFLALLGRLEKDLSLTADSPADRYFDVVILSRRLGLTDKCFGYLEAAARGAPDHAVGTLFRKLTIERAIERATLLVAQGKRIQAEPVLRELTQRTLPGYPPAADAVAALRRDLLSRIKDDFVSSLALQTEPEDGDANKPKTASELSRAATGSGAASTFTTKSDPRSSKPDAEKFCQEATRQFKQALAELPGYHRGTDPAMFQRLCKLLEGSVDLYGQALDLDPANKAIENRQVEVNSMLYGLRKNEILLIKRP